MSIKGDTPAGDPTAAPVTTRRWFFWRWKLRSLLLLTAVACIGLAIYATGKNDRRRLRQECEWRGWDVRATVSLDEESDHELFARYCRLESPNILEVYGQFEKRDIQAVSRLNNLRSLSIYIAAMTADDIRSLDAALPACRITISHMEPPQTGPEQGGLPTGAPR